MNIYQKHINRKSKMSMVMYNFQRKTNGLKEVSFRSWRVASRAIVKGNKSSFKLDDKKSLLEFRRYIRKEYKCYSRLNN